eukprot:3538706-Prorocentrum_lima.AAC.1
MVLNPRLYSALLDVEPISDRVQRATFDALTPFTVINVYAPQSYRTTQEKDDFYDTVSAQFQKWKNRGPTFVIGDWNVRLQCQRSEEAPYFGAHFFHPDRITLDHQSPE